MFSRKSETSREIRVTATHSTCTGRVRSIANLLGFGASVGVVVTCLVLVRAEATGVPPRAQTATSELDATIAARSRLVGLLQGQSRGMSCTFPGDEPRRAACAELATQIAEFERQIADLKRRAGGRWGAEGDGATVIQAGGLFDFLFGPRPARPNRERRLSDAPPGEWQGNARAYTTMCVRLCDGYYWPMSYAASGDATPVDEARCETSCASPAKLYRYPVPGGSTAGMRDRGGKPYADLPNAFRHKIEYVKDCRCKPDPWSAQAKAEYNERAVLQADLGPATSPEEAVALTDAQADEPAAAPAILPDRPRREPPVRTARRRPESGGGGLFSFVNPFR